MKCPFNEWYFGRKRGNRGIWVWKFGDKYKVNASTCSKAVWNPDTNVFKIWLNIYGNLRYSPSKSKESVGKALRDLFNAGKHLCYVSHSQGLRMYKGEYATRVEWYSKVDELPESGVMEQVVDVVKDSLEEYVCESRVIATGVTETYTAEDVEEKWGRWFFYRVRAGAEDGRSVKLSGRVWREV